VNHLAHALLAGDEGGVLLGSLLGDFWRGAPDPAWPAGVRPGVLLHRNIDVYTDSHPVVTAARALFDPPWRRYAGILIDVYFDHVLARDWQRNGRESLDAFSARIATLLDAHRAWLPGDLNRFAGYFRAHGLFAAYARREVIEQVLAGIGTRLRHANTLRRAGPALWARAAELDAAFERFFPDLVQFARMRRRDLLAGPDAAAGA
jgi:acyl carrier protein phosphodiesterase